MAGWALFAVLVAIAVLAAVVVLDVFSLGNGKRLTVLKQWQALVGTMLGFATAAGILALSQQLTLDSQRQTALEALQNVEQAVRIEAGQMDGVLAEALAKRDRLMTTSQPNAQPGCTGELAEMADSFGRRTLVYDAAVPHFVEVGAKSLGDFVAFYSLWGDIARDVQDYVRLGCQVVAPETAALVFTKIEAARADFAAMGK